MLNISAQPEGVDPFYDAVPYSVKKFNTAYLTNQDATTVKIFFENQRAHKPERIIKMDQGYHHGYRIYYQNTENPGGPEKWIQVFTTNVNECAEMLEAKNPELLESPFIGFKTSSLSYGVSESLIDSLIRKYRKIPTMYYRQTYNNQGVVVDELNYVFQKYYAKMRDQSGQMIASVDDGLGMMPVNPKDYSWSLWIQCLDEISQIGYRTLIEYSDPRSSE